MKKTLKNFLFPFQKKEVPFSYQSTYQRYSVFYREILRVPQKVHFKYAKNKNFRL